MYNSTNFKNQIDSLLADNTEGGISAEDLRTVLYNALDGAGGMSVYVNSNTTPQNIDASTWTQLLIDGLGTGSTEANLPYYFNNPLVAGSRMILDEIRDYSIVHFRTNIDVVTSTPSQEIRIHLKVYNSSDVEIYDMNVGDYDFKAVGAYEFTDHTMLYGNPALTAAGNYAQLEAYSDTGFTALFTQSVIRIAG